MKISRAYRVPATLRWTKVAFTAACLLAFTSTVGFAADDGLPGNPRMSRPDYTNPPLPGGWSLRAIGTETGSWESNPLMELTGAKSLYGSITTPELIIAGKTPTTLLTFDTLVNENIFNRSEFNSTDIHSKVGFDHKTQTWDFNLKQQTDYDTTRTSELFPVGINGTLLSTSVRHLGLSLGPEISYNPTTLDKITLAGSITNSQYEKSVFSDYLMASVTPSYTRQFDPMNAGVISLQAQRYQTTSGPRVYTDSIGPMLGWIGALTPRLTIKASGGVQTSRQYGSGATQRPWSLQYIYSGDLAFNGEQDTTHFTATRADYPFGNSTESLLTTFTIKEDHAINERFSVNAGASYVIADYQSSASGSLQNLISGNGGLTYHATQRLDINATYEYRRETLNDRSGNAEDNKVTFGITYHPLAWRL